MSKRTYLCGMKHIIPQAVKREAAYLSKIYGEHISYLGTENGAEYYKFDFPEDADTGFPFVYQYADGVVMTFNNFMALNIISSFIKD